MFCVAPNFVIRNVAFMAKYRYAVADDYVVPKMDSLGIAEVGDNIMSNLHAFTNVTAKPFPYPRSYSVLVYWL